MDSRTFETPVTDSVAKINDELAVGEDLTFQRRWWRFERVIWMIFVVIILLDLAGALGRGPLANASRRSADGGMVVEYERIERSGTPSIMTVTIDRPARPGDVELFISDGAVSDLGLRRVIPAPQTTTIEQDGLRYRFPRGTLPAKVRFEFEPERMGLHRIVVRGAGTEELAMRIAVVP